MGADQAQRIENAVGIAAAAALAAAGGFAGYQLAGTIAVGAAAAIMAFIMGKVLLQLLEGAPEAFPQPSFEILKIEPADPAALGELLLTEAEIVPASADEPLVLDDVLTEVAADSRVVRLFDLPAMPTPGQLKAKIDRHLDGGTPRSHPPDASDALFAALADLRRSLR